VKFGPMADAKKVNLEEVEGRSGNSREYPGRIPSSKIPVSLQFSPVASHEDERNSPLVRFPAGGEQVSSSVESLEPRSATR